MATQSLIIYRNPLEQSFYESGNLFPLLCSIGAMGVTVFLLVYIIDIYSSRISRETVRLLNMIPFIVGIIVLIATYNHMAL